MTDAAQKAAGHSDPSITMMKLILEIMEYIQVNLMQIKLY